MQEKEEEVEQAMQLRGQGFSTAQRSAHPTEHEH